MAASLPGGIPGRVAPYTSLTDFVSDADRFLSARRAVCDGAPKKKRKQYKRHDKRWTSYLHACIDASAHGPLKRITRAKLTRVQREVLIALLVDALAVRNLSTTPRGIARELARDAREHAAVLRAAHTDSRLIRSGLVLAGEGTAPHADRVLQLDPRLVDEWSAPPRASVPFEDLAALDLQLQIVTRALRERGAQVHFLERGMGSELDARNALLDAERAVDDLRASLEDSSWSLARLFTEFSDRTEQGVLLLLASRPLGHRGPTFGRGLLEAANTERPYRGVDRRVLERLQFRGAIECKGRAKAPALQASFRLTRATSQRYGLPERRSSRIQRVRSGFDHLALTPKVRAALAPVLHFGRDVACRLSDWGFDEAVPYGRALSVLLSGPPGVGKTACARAVAAELDRGLLQADYSELISSWVGETESNVAELFAHAREYDAVLLLDEADTLLYDRSHAHYAWEVSAINVLLTELERFEGICFLTTNRKGALDPALSRRIAIKIELTRPGLSQRREIWSVLIPEAMPLASDVDFDRLSTVDLSGGEIKNVIMQAARTAAARGADSRVTQSDFEAALLLELEGQWGRGHARPAGFAVPGQSVAS